MQQVPTLPHPPRFFATLSNIVMNTFVIKVQGMNICSSPIISTDCLQMDHFSLHFCQDAMQMVIPLYSCQSLVIAKVSSILRKLLFHFVFQLGSKGAEPHQRQTSVGKRRMKISRSWVTRRNIGHTVQFEFQINNR